MRRSLFVPEWLSVEVSEALSQISGAQVAKKEATILRLAEATASGESWSVVFARPETCTKSVWYGFTKRTGKRKLGWCEDVCIKHALAVATARARWWVRVKRGKAVQDALDLLVEGSEDAARQLVNLVRLGQVVFAREQPDGVQIARVDADVREVLAAAKEVLDRVSELTATKQQTMHSLNADQFAQMMRKAEEKAKTLEELAEQWEPE
jgi:hypothetical protein